MATHDLISSADVNGTDVFGRDGTHIGHIDHLMIDKVSGQIAYAVMAFGGVLGLGEQHHAVPWKKLSYDTAQGGYVTDLTREQVEGAPQRPDSWADDPDYHERVYSHYAVPPYWI